MASSLKGHTCSLPLRKRELFLRLLGCETNMRSHCDLGGRHKAGAWKVGWVPSEKEDFLDQKGLGLVEDHLGWGSLAWTFQLHLASKEESPSISTLECPYKSDSGQTNSKVRDCQAPWEPYRNGSHVPECVLLPEFLLREL